MVREERGLILKDVKNQGRWNYILGSEKVFWNTNVALFSK